MTPLRLHAARRKKSEAQGRNTGSRLKERIEERKNSSTFSGENSETRKEGRSKKLQHKNGKNKSRTCNVVTR